MNYIEQLMEEAGVKRIVNCKACSYDYKLDCPSDTCIKIFPDFTAEKQLEIIKLISDFHLYTMDNGSYDLRGQYYSLVDPTGDFSQALAQLTTELMNAGELEKEKVKEILENG